MDRVPLARMFDWSGLQTASDVARARAWLMDAAELARVERCPDCGAVLLDGPGEVAAAAAAVTARAVELGLERP